MNKLAPVMKSLMREKAISITELARQIHISQPVLHRLASGITYNPQIETLIPIAHFFGVTLDQLVGNTPLPYSKDTHTPAQQWANVPLLKLDQVLNWLDHDLSTKPTKFVSTDSPVNKKSYAVRLNDSTMQPRFTEGTVLIINPEYPPEDQDFVIAQANDEKIATFKQLLTDGENLYLKPLNPDFPIVQMTKDHRILGTMVQARIDYGKKYASP